MICVCVDIYLCHSKGSSQLNKYNFIQKSQFTEYGEQCTDLFDMSTV